MLMELKMIGTSDDRAYVAQVKLLFDEYAEQFDEILRVHGTGMAKELKSLASVILADIKKITEQQNLPYKFN